MLYVRAELRLTLVGRLRSGFRLQRHADKIERRQANTLSRLRNQLNRALLNDSRPSITRRRLFVQSDLDATRQANPSYRLRLRGARYHGCGRLSSRRLRSKNKPLIMFSAVLAS
jgi:hypothetical protein